MQLAQWTFVRTRRPCWSKSSYPKRLVDVFGSEFRGRKTNVFSPLGLKMVAMWKRSMSRFKFVGIWCNLLKVREKSCMQVAISFGFPSHRLINWREIFKPITKRSNCNRAITIESHLKTSLTMQLTVSHKNSDFIVLHYLQIYIITRTGKKEGKSKLHKLSKAKYAQWPN